MADDPCRGVQEISRGWMTRRGTLSQAVCQYIRGQRPMVFRLDDPQLFSGRFASPTISNDLELNLLPLAEASHARALDGADVNKYIIATGLRLNESEALLAVKPLYSSRAQVRLILHLDMDLAAPW